MKRYLAAFTLAVIACTVIACTPPATTIDNGETASSGVDSAIADVVTQAMPGVVIAGGQADGAGEYEVTGTLNGQEYEFDLMGPDGGWRVVEIQRDIAWTQAPDEVRIAAAAAPNAFEPERVIESRQPQGGDGGVIYELFAPGQADAPAMEIRFMDGEAALMPPAH